MAIREVFMPALSSTMTEGKIVSWTKSPGDRVEKGDTVLVVESDKADMDVESFAEGYLAIIMSEAGSSVAVKPVQHLPAPPHQPQQPLPQQQRQPLHQQRQPPFRPVAV
jgi:pyruvate dehydrogenase E2 component (dihydrolipoamide acetyltransferase)